MSLIRITTVVLPSCKESDARSSSTYCGRRWRWWRWRRQERRYTRRRKQFTFVPTNRVAKRTKRGKPRRERVEGNAKREKEKRRKAQERKEEGKKSKGNMNGMIKGVNNKSHHVWERDRSAQSGHQSMCFPSNAIPTRRVRGRAKSDCRSRRCTTKKGSDKG